MTKTNKNELYKKLTIVIVGITLFCTALFWLSAITKKSSTHNTVISLEPGWYYYDISNPDKRIYVELPCEIKTGQKLTLYYDGTKELETGKVIATYGAVYDVEMYIGDTLLYQFKDNGREINNAVRGNIVCSGGIPEREAGQDLRMVYHSKSGLYHLTKITVSTVNALFYSVLLKSIFGLIVSIAMTVIGVLSIILWLAMKSQQESDNRIMCIGMFLLFCGLWCLSDCAFVQMIFGYSDLIFDLDFYLFMIMPVPLAYFVLNTGNMRRKKGIKVVPFLYYINIILQSIFALKGIFTFFKMLYVTHVLMMSAGVVYSLFVMIKEYKNQKSSEMLLSIRALASVGLLGTFAIFLYEFFSYSTYQMVYQTGLLILMLVLLIALLKEFIQSVRNRTEAIIYKQMSEQDKLTKLDNRRAFDSLMKKIENNSIHYYNAALLFMDVNYLKQANDTYGHEVGDKLIISAAQCIRESYQNAGYCYRIGGDEFCAVLLDPSRPAEELLGQLAVEVDKINQKNELPTRLSIAAGCSFIEEDGIRKTISQWKTEADDRMYENKRLIKKSFRL